MLSEALGAAIGVALSPFPIIPAVLLLLSPRPRATGLAYLAGWLAGLVVVTGAAAVLSDLVSLADSTPVWVSWLRIVVGVLLVVVGVRQWVRRNPEAGLPGWVASIQDSTPSGACRLGFLLAVANPKVLVLAGSAGLNLGAYGSSTGATVAAVVGFSLIAAAGVLVPVLAYVVAGERLRGPLERGRDWLVRNNDAVTGIVLAAIGVLFAADGVAGL